MKSRRKWLKSWILSLLIGGTIINFLAGCGNSTGKSPDYPPSNSIAVLDVNELAPFRGVLITHEKHYWYMRCENECLQRGILP